ncbi:acyl-CoA dehydrogenase family protein [Herminiimonas arsenitoxidans]|uniref:acyl-CoA dehydrogenase family protein n=1 Tax=Herminiimonas arsenitoxidans TaxID=1809410 RepID=UPI0009708ADF|nr:acyl-CoA dehydrogenase family protein [Herminiimonas arsenitoxidans]
MDVADDISSILRDAASTYIAGRYDPADLQKDSLKPRLVDRRLWREMAEMGWLGICLPESVGGSELGLDGAVVLSEVFGRTLFPVPFATAVCMPSELIRVALNDGVSDAAAAIEFSQWIIAGERLLTLAWQERPGQMFVEQAETVLKDGKVSGRKIFVPALEEDSVLLVQVSNDGESAVVAVAADAPGVSYELFASGLGSYATVTFDAAPILHTRPLLQGRSAEAALRRALAAGRIVLSAQLAGLASGCLEKTIKYVGERVQFNRPIGSFQTIQHRCVDLHIDTLLAAASWRNAVHCWPQDESIDISHASDAAISAAKARCGDTAMKVAKQAVQMHGAMGFAEEVDVGFYLRAAMQSASILGDAHAHRRHFVQASAALVAGVAHV